MSINKYQKLFKYINYFENTTIEEACHWGGGMKEDNGVITISYPIYDKQLTNFIDEVYKTDLIDNSYIETLKKYRLTMSNELINAIDSSNYELAKAILTCYVRQERFCDGLWASAVKDKVFFKLLKKIEQLEQEKINS